MKHNPKASEKQKKIAGKHHEAHYVEVRLERADARGTYISLHVSSNPFVTATSPFVLILRAIFNVLS